MLLHPWDIQQAYFLDDLRQRCSHKSPNQLSRNGFKIIYNMTKILLQIDINFFVIKLWFRMSVSFFGATVLLYEKTWQWRHTLYAKNKIAMLFWSDIEIFRRKSAHRTWHYKIIILIKLLRKWKSYFCCICNIRVSLLADWEGV